MKIGGILGGQGLGNRVLVQPQPPPSTSFGDLVDRPWELAAEGSGGKVSSAFMLNQT